LKNGLVEGIFAVRYRVSLPKEKPQCAANAIQPIPLCGCYGTLRPA